MLDPQVSHMLSRDLDSLVSDREVSAVKEWLESDKAFHFMRDNPSHGIEILGLLFTFQLFVYFFSTVCLHFLFTFFRIRMGNSNGSIRKKND